MSKNQKGSLSPIPKDLLLKEKLKSLIQKNSNKIRKTEKSNTPVRKNESKPNMLDLVSKGINNLKCISNNDPKCQRKKELLLKYFTDDKDSTTKKDNSILTSNREKFYYLSKYKTERNESKFKSCSFTPIKFKYNLINTNNYDSNRSNFTIAKEKYFTENTKKSLLQSFNEEKSKSNSQVRFKNCLYKYCNSKSPVEGKIAIKKSRKIDVKCYSSEKIKISGKLLTDKENSIDVSKSRDISQDRSSRKRSPQAKKSENPKIQKTLIYSKNKQLVKMKKSKNSKPITNLNSIKSFKEVVESVNYQKNLKKILSVGQVSKKGSSGENVPKINQDNFAIIENFPLGTGSSAFFVFDGHGVNGHFVSEFLKQNLPKEISKNLISNSHKKYKNSVIQIIEDSFISTNQKLNSESDLNTEFSGSTCVSVFITSEKLYCANVGDSRAIIAKLLNNEENIWKFQLLSRDHKPGDSDEESRIIKNGGRIQSFQGKNNESIGPLRVWKKDEDIPGLAMTRAFGDKVASEVGVIASPEVFELSLTDEDKIVVLASDGLWEFIRNNECVQMIKEFYKINDSQAAAQYLVDQATIRWINEEDIRDDITVIVVFLDNL